MLQNVLPLGFEHQGKIYREFKLNKIGGFAERVIHDDNLRSERPQTWMARMVACLVNEIGGESVSYDFEQGGGKEIPELVKRIPLADTGVILVQGHAFTFGNVLKGQRTRKCPDCRKHSTKNIDLAALSYTGITEEALVNAGDVTKSVKVKLDTGWKRIIDPSLTGQTLQGWEDRTFDVFEFGVPTIGDALRNEKYLVPNRMLDFQIRLLNDRLMKVSCSTDGFEMPQAFFESAKAGMLFFADRGGLLANDRLLIRDAVNGLPQVDMKLKVLCDHCSTEFEIGVDYTAFFPLVS